MSFPTKNILIVTTEEELKFKLNFHLTNLGYKTRCVNNGESAIEILNTEFPNLVILDIILPKQDGFELCRKIRAAYQVPIILLSPFSSTSDRIIGFEVGADDYLTKPFSAKELEIRIGNILKRLAGTKGNSFTNSKPKISFGSFVIDFETKSICTTSNANIKLTTLEFNILELLLMNVDSVISRSDILNNVWGYTPERAVDLRVVDVYISRLRNKLGENSRNPTFILTVRGGGYMFKK